MKGGFGCSPCCDPCPPCEQECVEPHTGDPFEVVYTRFFEGVEAGNPTDGYLTATGDSDTDDPYDGMDGSAPWYQQVSGSFSFGPGVTRHPCSINISFWRNSYALGPATVPPAGSALTYEKIKVTCNTGKIIVGETILEAGQEYESPQEIPVVAGTGDQSGSDPVTYYGTISVRPVCREASFSVQARIQWETQKRQHVLYGKVRECYEDPENPPCATYCDGDPPPDVLYLTISNYTGPEPASGSPNGTYVLERFPGVCDGFLGAVPWGCRPNSLTPDSMLEGYDEARAFRKFISIGSWQIVNGECKILLLVAYDGSSVDKSYCGEGVLHSGTGLVYVHTRLFGALPEDIVPGSFDWEIST